MALLAAGEPQVDENSRGAAQDNSLSRCPDGGGGPRRTAAYRPANPTPGRPNDCPAADAPPGLASVSPAPDAADVAVDAALIVTFDEDVWVEAGWLTVTCAAGGPVALVSGGGPRAYTLTPAAPFAPGDTCLARLVAAAVRDSDAEDPPDHPAADVEWSFAIAPAVVAPPLAAFTAASPLWMGQTAQFVNTTTGDAPLHFVWDFGDGSPPSSAAQPAHRYAAPGVYTVTLAASNPGGQSTATAIIEVRPRQVYWPFIAVTIED